MKKTIILFLLFAVISCSPYNINNEIESFYNYPNPFSSKDEDTTFKLVLKDGCEIEYAEVSVYNSEGTLIDKVNLTIDKTAKNTAGGKWRGVDKHGNALPASVYHSEVFIRDSNGGNLSSSQKVSIK